MSELAKQKEESAFFNNLFLALKSFNSKESVANVNHILSEISKDQSIQQLGELGKQLSLFSDEKTKGALESFKDQINAIQSEKFKQLLQLVNGVNVTNFKKVIDTLSLLHSKGEEGENGNNVPLIQVVTNDLVLYEDFLQKLIMFQETTKSLKEAYSLDDVENDGNPATSDIIAKIKDSIDLLEKKVAAEIQGSIKKTVDEESERINKQLESIISTLKKQIETKIKSVDQLVTEYLKESNAEEAQKQLGNFIRKIQELQQKLSHIEKTHMEEGSRLLRSFYEQHFNVVSNHQKHSSRNIYVVFGLLGSILLAVLYLIVDLKTPIH